jgi:hypothetical protein
MFINKMPGGAELENCLRIIKNKNKPKQPVTLVKTTYGAGHS